MYIYIYSPKVSPVWCFFLIHPPLSDSICTTSEDQRKYVHWRTYHVCFALYWDDDVQCLYSMPSTSSKFIMEHHETNVHGHMCWKSSNSPPVVIDLGVEFSSYSVRVCWKKKRSEKIQWSFHIPYFPNETTTTSASILHKHPKSHINFLDVVNLYESIISRYDIHDSNNSGLLWVWNNHFLGCVSKKSPNIYLELPRPPWLKTCWRSTGQDLIQLEFLGSSTHGCFHSHGGTPIAEWFISWKIPTENRW